MARVPSGIATLSPTRTSRDTRACTTSSTRASSLLNDLLRQIEKEKTGAYQAPYYFTEAAESY